MYADPTHGGVVQSVMYTPLSFFAYLPTTLFSSPTIALLAGAVLSLLYYFAPARGDAFHFLGQLAEWKSARFPLDAALRDHLPRAPRLLCFPARGFEYRMFGADIRTVAYEGYDRLVRKPRLPGYDCYAR